MTVRFRKKVTRMRGSKTHGWGGKKKHRGGGSKGGKGYAGLLKHKKSWMLKYEPDHFGKRGFKKPNATKERRIINLCDIERIAAQRGTNDIDVSALGYDKVLGTGHISMPLKIKAASFSARAKKKIEEAGGQWLT